MKFGPYFGISVNEVKEKGAPDRSTFRYKEGLLSIFIFLEDDGCIMTAESKGV